MIKSMTAYAEKTMERDGFTVTVELKTYNSRYLDPVLRMPSAYRSFENQIKQLIAENICRGRVEFFLTITDERPSAVPIYHVDKARATACYDALCELQAETGIEGDIPIDLVARTEGVITTAEPVNPGDAEWRHIAETLKAALDALNDMRATEGAFMGKDLAARLDRIEAMVVAIETQSEGLVDACYQRLQERITTLLQGTGALDENRIAQEVAMIADKSDVSEEIVRAKSHIDQFRSAMAENEPCGRKLNFLLQEFNREFNTMGSKTGNVDISEHVVAAKTELEKLREQVQNVE
ncbi:MAG: YicC/YloC family endoribonuclease [Thermodesulfobacteriota bacterium]|nr:YicC/YloC family endoribonuclease [Thermodesulfobacteriota bacterium]